MNEKLFNTDYLKHLCHKFGLRPSKNYGQNYLINPEVIETIVAAAEINKKDVVVEVGPGFGVLTFSLLEKAKKVIAFEIEKKLSIYWEDNKKDNLEIIWGNVLRTEEKYFPKKYKVVANIPYQITSPLLKMFLEQISNRPIELVLMVQKEVAQRICAQPGQMSVLAVAVQYYAQASILGVINRNNFWPEPQVDSALIKIVPLNKKHDPVSDAAIFRLVKAGFAQKRKLLIKNLLPIIGKENKGKLLAALKELGFSETVRAQELSISDWEKLSKISTLL